MSTRLPADLDAGLPALHLDVLYVTDDRGRLEAVRSDSVGTPLLHLFRGTMANRWLIGTAIPEDVAARAESLLAEEPVEAPDRWEHHPPRCAEALRTLLTPFRTAATASDEYRGPAFAFPGDLRVTGDPEVYQPDGDESMFAPRLAWAASASPAEAPIVVSRDEAGRVVSLCHSARSTSEGAEAGLETIEEARRRGHALAVTSRWAGEVRAGGRTPLYGTSWGNEGSRAVARRLGLILYGEDWHFG